MSNIGNDDLKIAVIVVASISCAFSGYVILSYMAFKEFHDRLQGIVQGYFAVASWLWTTVLSYTIFSVISNGKVNFKLWHARVFCWTLPMILTL
eukprot:gene41205-55727_t